MKIIGNINLEGDKSISHRALMVASICNGKSMIKNLSCSKDVLSTINCLRETGINISINADCATVHGETFRIPKGDLNCYNSGTSMRLLAGLYSSVQLPVTLCGDSSLSKRPMDRIIDPLSKMGASIESSDGRAPIRLSQFKPTAITYEISVASSQVKSCLILASLGIEGKSIIRQRVGTRNHLELMIDSISNDAIEYRENEVIIHPGAKDSLNAFDMDIPGDTSCASYLIGLAVLLRDSRLVINNLLLNPHRMGLINTLISMGANIQIDNVDTIRNEKVGSVTVRGDSQLNPCCVSRDKIPAMIDEIPMLSLICSHIKGTSIIEGLEELKYKESDRLSGIHNILSEMGVDINMSQENSIEISGDNKLYNTNKLRDFNDHRLAMVVSCAQILSENKITFNDCTNISFPKFQELINKVVVDR